MHSVFRLMCRVQGITIRRKMAFRLYYSELYQGKCVHREQGKWLYSITALRRGGAYAW